MILISIQMTQEIKQMLQILQMKFEDQLLQMVLLMQLNKDLYCFQIQNYIQMVEKG